MNVILVSGFIGKDAEVSTFDWGEVMKFTVATTERYKNKNDEWVTDTTWHNVEKIGKNLENFAKYLKKGVTVEVRGQQQHRKVEDKYFSSIKADDIRFCPTKKTDGESQQDNSSAEEDDDNLPF